MTVTIDLLGRKVMLDTAGDDDDGDDLYLKYGEQGAAAMAASVAEMPQGGGAAVSGPQQAQHAVPRISVCPTMAKYTFVPPNMKKMIVKRKKTAGVCSGGDGSRLQHDGE